MEVMEVPHLQQKDAFNGIEVNMDMARDMARDMAYLHIAIKVFRVSLAFLNLIVILFSLYFGITGRDLFGNKFDTNQGIVILLSTGVIAIAFLGLINAFWWGQLKQHLNIAISYAVSVIVVIIGALIASLFGTDISGADVLFIVLTTLCSALLFVVSSSFAFCVYKAKKWSKIKKKGLKHIHKLNKINHNL